MSTAEKPRRRWQMLILLCALGAMLCAALAGYDYGYQRGLDLHGSWLLELEDLRERRLLSETALAQLSQQLVHQRQSARIDRAAAEQVRTEMVVSENSMAALREEIVFYRGLMSPTTSEHGLGIRSFQLFPGNGPRRFQFELVMQQLAVSHKLLKGALHLSVAGRSLQEPAVLPLEALSAATADGRINFSFKYFERIKGEIELPQGFEPEGVDISVRTWGRPVQRLEKSYPWSVEGS
jgi:hypothetical protein